MKTKILLSVFMLLIISSITYSNTVIITNQGSAFKPAEITIQPGDTVIFSISNTHNAVEVSKSTWDNRGTESNGGFNLGFGGGQVIFDSVGTYYYVCTPHVAFNMKGVINVGVVTGTQKTILKSDNQKELTAVYPNPFSDQLALHFTLTEPSRIAVDLLEITGKSVGRIMDKQFNAGEQSELFDLSSLKSGQYLLYYKSSQESIVLPLVKVQ